MQMRAIPQEVTFDETAQELVLVYHNNWEAGMPGDPASFVPDKKVTVRMPAVAEQI